MLRLKCRYVMTGVLLASSVGSSAASPRAAGAAVVAQFARVSTSSAAKQLPAGAAEGVVSADGRFVACTSDAETLPGGAGCSAQVCGKDM